MVGSEHGNLTRTVISSFSTDARERWNSLLVSAQGTTSIWLHVSSSTMRQQSDLVECFKHIALCIGRAAITACTIFLDEIKTDKMSSLFIGLLINSIFMHVL